VDGFTIGARKGPLLLLQELLSEHLPHIMVVFPLQYGNDLLGKGPKRPTQKVLLVQDLASRWVGD